VRTDGQTDMIKLSHCSPFCERAQKLPAPSGNRMTFPVCTQPRQWTLPHPGSSSVQTVLTPHRFSHASAILSSTSRSLQQFLLDICSLLRYYAACSGNSLPTFRDNLSVPVRRANNFLTLASYPRSLKDASCIILQFRWAVLDI
jgi:hypothetical protein